MQDLKNNLDVAESIDADNRTASVNGVGVDLQNFNGAMMVFIGNDADTTTGDETYVPKLQDSPDNSAWSDVVAADQEGSLLDMAANEIQRVGYKGNKRYIRGVITLAGTTPVIDCAAVVVRGHPRKAPVA